MTEDNLEKDTNRFTKENLEDALLAINSLINKCEKAQLKVIHKTSQSTLLINRLRALNIASLLISKELQNDEPLTAKYPLGFGASLTGN
ncbi:MAG: hypothetical protein WC384_20380 [Prolixibacteraceae bacterium]|jgi:hypothetical protein